MGIAQRSSAQLAPLRGQERIQRAREIARITGERITLVSSDGEVLFDSDVKEGIAIESHHDRTEVLEALTRGTGRARRTSKTTGVETLYAAARLPLTPESGPPIVRVGRPVAEVRDAIADFNRFYRNVQAVAISVAILFSLLSALQFLRPLRKVIAAAKALGAGDLAARTGLASDDEVGDAGRALDNMAVEIRRRLANAGSGDAILSQLVDALPVPCVVFEVTGEVLALNGAARAAYRVEGPNASRRLQEITASQAFERALEQAERDGEPEPVAIEIAHGVPEPSTVHVLKRPGAAPLYVLLGVGPVCTVATVLPSADDALPRSFADVLERAKDDASSVLAQSGVAIEVGEAPHVLVVDVEQRVQKALAECLQGCARAVQGKSDTLTIDVKVEDTRVTVALEADAGADVLGRIEPLLEPLGGSVRVERQRATTLWIPRA
jgi:hypothetical protein